MRITRGQAAEPIVGSAFASTTRALGQNALPEIAKGPFDGSLQGLNCAYQIPEWFKGAPNSAYGPIGTTVRRLRTATGPGRNPEKKQCTQVELSVLRARRQVSKPCGTVWAARLRSNPAEKLLSGWAVNNLQDQLLHLALHEGGTIRTNCGSIIQTIQSPRSGS
jgi:hypothetical protein